MPTRGTRCTREGRFLDLRERFSGWQAEEQAKALGRRLKPNHYVRVVKIGVWDWAVYTLGPLDTREGE